MLTISDEDATCAHLSLTTNRNPGVATVDVPTPHCSPGDVGGATSDARGRADSAVAQVAVP